MILSLDTASLKHHEGDSDDLRINLSSGILEHESKIILVTVVAAGLSESAPSAKEYLARHAHACAWARVNRQLIAHRLLGQLSDTADLEPEVILDVCHNNVVRLSKDCVPDGVSSFNLLFECWMSTLSRFLSRTREDSRLSRNVLVPFNIPWIINKTIRLFRPSS